MSNNELSFWRRIVKKLTGANELGHEEEVMTDHEYDGIRELDNVLPPWWLAGFYITIAIGIFYYVMVLAFGKYKQADEYNAEVARENATIEQYRKDNPELFDDANLVALTDPMDLQKGKELFASKTCTACHLADGGGSIGPNLTDEYWINGGGFKNIYNTIAKGGRPGKGMGDDGGERDDESAAGNPPRGETPRARWRTASHSRDLHRADSGRGY